MEPWHMPQVATPLALMDFVLTHLLVIGMHHTIESVDTSIGPNLLVELQQQRYVAPTMACTCLIL